MGRHAVNLPVYTSLTLNRVYMHAYVHVARKIKFYPDESQVSVGPEEVIVSGLRLQAMSSPLGKLAWHG